MKCKSQTNTGSVLLLVLIVLSIGTVAMIALFGTTNSFFKMGGLFRKQVTLELKANSGIEIAKADLQERAQNKDYIEVAKTEESAIKKGLLPHPSGNRDCKTGVNCEPRFDPKKEGDIETTLIYIPDPNNTQDPDKLPKSFTVISQAQNTKTGETYTIEALFEMKKENFAEMTFGMLHPKFKKWMGVFNFMPATYGGHVHFGNFECGSDPLETCEPWAHFHSYGQDKQEESKHVFEGPVTFAGGALNLEEDPYFRKGDPFTHSKWSTLQFKKGYQTHYTLDQEVDDIYDQTVAQTSTPIILPDSSGHVCLKLDISLNEGTGYIKKYTCNPKEEDPAKRYDGEKPVGQDGGITLPIDLQKETVLVCGDKDHPCNLHIKGILKGALTVAAENITLEGDVQYSDQARNSSKDRFGVLAKKDIMIPRVIPSGSGYSADIDSENPKDPNNPYLGITNFIPPTGDRDMGNTEYVDHFARNEENHGSKNYPGTLDIDGMLMAAGGKLYVEGYHDLDTNPEGATSILDQTGKAWPYKKGTSKASGAYYFCDPNNKNCDDRNNWEVQAPPKYCGEMEGGRCKLWSEDIRPRHGNIWIFGGLVTDDYSFTRVGESGFLRRVIYADQRLIKNPPPGFPDTGNAMVFLMWAKTYAGKSPLLASN